MAWSTSSGKYGHYITVDADGLVTVSSCSAPHVQMIARGFLEKIAAGLNIDLSSVPMTVRATKLAAPALVIARAASHRETRSDGKEV